jgi:hypothetical protein
VRALSLLLLGPLTLACAEGGGGASDAAVVDYATINVETDSKALIYNLIGRWFPEAEIKRLDDDTMTPESWCAREPTHLLVELDQVSVQCDQGLPQEAAIARVERSGGGIHLVLRAKEDAQLKSLIFTKAVGTQVQVAGSPCDDSQPQAYARFHRFETLERQILSGKRCAQINHQAIVLPGADE